MLKILNSYTIRKILLEEPRLTYNHNYAFVKMNTNCRIILIKVYGYKNSVDMHKIKRKIKYFLFSYLKNQTFIIIINIRLEYKKQNKKSSILNHEMLLHFRKLLITFIYIQKLQ